MIFSRFTATLVVLTVGLTMSYFYVPADDSAPSKATPRVESEAVSAEPSVATLLFATSTRAKDGTPVTTPFWSGKTPEIAAQTGLAVVPFAAPGASAAAVASQTVSLEPAPTSSLPSAIPLPVSVPDDVRAAAKEAVVNDPISTQVTTPTVTGGSYRRYQRDRQSTANRHGKRTETMFLHPLGQR